MSPRVGRWPRLLSLAVGLLLFAGGVAAQIGLQGRVRAAPHAERLYFPSGRFLREAAVGFREMAADYLWFRTVQYYGAFRQGENDLRYFHGLIEGVNQLDPRFVEAYNLSALVACMDQNNLALAIDDLKRGILANPDRWILPFNIGFMYYVFTRDYARAACWFQAAAESPDATDFARRFAAFARKRAGDLETSLVLWQNLLATTSSPDMKELARQMIAECQRLLAARSGAAEAQP